MEKFCYVILSIIAGISISLNENTAKVFIEFEYIAGWFNQPLESMSRMSRKVQVQSLGQGTSKMNTIRLTIIGLMLCIIGNIQAQEQYLGLFAGIVNYESSSYSIPTSGKNCLFAFRAEYHPYKAIFSIITGTQYLTGVEYLQVPLALNFQIGNTFKFKLIGGIVPTIRLNLIAPNKTFVIGGELGIGLEYKINSKYVAFSDFTGYSIPELYYAPSHFGDKEIDRELDMFMCISIGLKYLIRKNTK